MRREWLIGLVLLVITLIGFWPVGRLGFIDYDDRGKDGYIVDNPNIQAGITAKSVRWAFTTAHASNWHPVTWLSHMLDCQLFGLNASGHHWMNLGFHIANTLLLFVLLRGMTGAVWRSALVAALFALHPLRVESVAWISERKDVLSGFFFLLTLLCYAKAVTSGKGQVTRTDEQPAQTKATPASIMSPVTWHPSRYYWLALGFFALGLMSKPMLVTLPVILLLLDFWPLKRISNFGFRISDSKSVPQLTGTTKQSEGGSTLNHLLLEKVPFLVLSVASSVVTAWAQNKGGAVMSLGVVPWNLRAANSLVFYTDYLGKMFWPANLSILYLYPYVRIPSGEILGSGLLLLGLSVFWIWRVRSQPYLFVGWGWFVVMLLPVIGLVLVGIQSIADRYTYLPSIGLFILVVWGLAGVASVSRFWRTTMTLGATTLILACLLDTRQQLRYWRNSVTLFSHAIEARGENPAVNFYLGLALVASGNPDEAAKNYRTVIKMFPDFEAARYRLGYILLQQKKYEEAKGQFNEVLRLNPGNIFALKFLGDIFLAQGKYAEAEAEYAAVLQPKSDDSAIRTAKLLADQEFEDKATLANLYNTLKNQLMPEVHLQVAFLRATRGEYQDAVDHYGEALRLKPDAPDVLNNLAWLLATCPDANVRDGQRAIQTAERACTLTDFKQTLFVGTLAAAYAEAGRFDEAVATAQKACALAEKSGKQDLLKRNQELLALYRSHQPYHETQCVVGTGSR
jgi:tetratricopeptide (TPR) repeat protein